MNFRKWIEDWRREYGEEGLDAYLCLSNGDGTHTVVPNRRPPGMSEVAWFKRRCEAAEAWLNLDNICTARIIATECDMWKKCELAYCRRARYCLGPTHHEILSVPQCFKEEEVCEDIETAVLDRMGRAEAMMYDEDEDFD